MRSYGRRTNFQNMNIKELQRQEVIRELKKTGISAAGNGEGLHNLEYEELKYMLVMERAKND